MSRARKRPESWTGQIGMDVGEQKARVEPESSVLDRVRKALEMAGCVKVMRNNVGAFKLGRRFFRAGLDKGSSDLVAIVAPYGRWLCIETKRGKGGVVTDEQKAWLKTMENYGAVVGVCTTPEQALELLKRARRPAFEDEVA